jgi:hypothetical protein
VGLEWKLKLKVMIQLAHLLALPLQTEPQNAREGKNILPGRVLNFVTCRGEEEGMETGGRTRRPKSKISSFVHFFSANFSEDYVYDDYVMRT